MEYTTDESIGTFEGDIGDKIIIRNMLEVKTKPTCKLQDVQMALDQLKTIGLNLFELKN